MRASERETETETQTDRDRQTGGQADRQTYRQTYRQRHRETETEKERHRQTGKDPAWMHARMCPCFCTFISSFAVCTYIDYLNSRTQPTRKPPSAPIHFTNTGSAKSNLHAVCTPQLFYGLNNIKQNFMHEAYVFLSELANLAQLMSRRNDSRTDNLLKQGYTLSEREKAERASNLIRQNLLRLNIYLEDLSVVEYRQLPAYGLADLFADIGGTLGLWMGISVLTIMELMELIIRLVFLLFNSENQPPSAQDEEQEYVASNGSVPTLQSGHAHGGRESTAYDTNYHQGDFVNASGFDYKVNSESVA